MARGERPVPLPLFCQDFLGSSAVRGMNKEQIGMYLILMMTAWQENPPCTLPNHPPTLMRWTLCTPEEWESLGGAVMSCWEPIDNNRLVNYRLKREYDFMVKRSREGLAAAEARWGKPPNADSMRNECGSNADSMPPNQTNPIPMDGKPKPQDGEFNARNWDGWLGSVRELLIDIGIHGDNLNALAASDLTTVDVLREGWRIKADGDAKRPVNLLVHRLCKLKGITLKGKRARLGTVLAAQADLAEDRLRQIRANRK